MILGWMGAAAALGAVSSAHCLVMCGPLVAAGCSAGPSGSRHRSSAGYFAGRSASYTFAGALAGAMGHPWASGSVAREVRIAVGLALAAILVWTAMKWKPTTAGSPSLVTLRAKAPRSLLARAARLVPKRGLGLGLSTGLFPCGALGSALLAAAVTGSTLSGSAFMLTFSLASAPALFVGALFGQRARGFVLGLSARARLAARAGLVAAAGYLAIAPWIAPRDGASCACGHAARVP